ncbi:MAG: hypothetical protein WC683_13120 [bacterium]
MPVLYTNYQLDEARELYPSCSVVAIANHCNSAPLCDALRGHGYKAVRHILTAHDTDFTYAVAVEGKLTKSQVREVEAFCNGYLTARPR